MAKVTVIIPTHNRAGFISTAIASVLRQTYQDFEIVVVDDASTDNTAAIVKGLKDPRIRYLRNETNRGDAGSRNIGILNSHSEYIGFLDDDDEWLPEKLELQMNLLENNPEVAGVCTDRSIVNRDTGRVLKSFASEIKGKIADEILKGNCITTSSVVVRRDCITKIGLFDERIPYNNDYDCWIRISKEFQFEFINKPLVKYYEHENKLSTNYLKMIAGIERILEKHGTFFMLDRSSYSRRCSELGLLYCLSGNTASGKRAFLRAIRVYPLRVKVYLHFCLSLLGADVFQSFASVKKRFRNNLWGPDISQC